MSAVCVCCVCPCVMQHVRCCCCARQQAITTAVGRQGVCVCVCCCGWRGLGGGAAMSPANGVRGTPTPPHANDAMLRACESPNRIICQCTFAHALAHISDTLIGGGPHRTCARSAHTHIPHAANKTNKQQLHIHLVFRSIFGRKMWWWSF